LVEHRRAICVHVISHLIVAFLVNADPIIVTMNANTGTLVVSLPIKNIATALPSDKNIRDNDLDHQTQFDAMVQL
jgi:uncharacterized protein YccT (UPF0319 family)